MYYNARNMQITKTVHNLNEWKSTKSFSQYTTLSFT